MFQYTIAFLPLVLFVVFAVLLNLKRWAEDRDWAEDSREKSLRPPGESLRRQIKEYDSRINDCLLYVGIAVIIQVASYLLLKSTASGSFLVNTVSAISLITALLTLLFLVRTALLTIRRSRGVQGFHGERLVGERLSDLMLDGYRVFHDLQFDGFNVDHAVVGPGGVFAIETRTRRKRKQAKSNEVVKFDGKQLHWPDGKVNDWGIKNAFERSDTLRLWLCSALEEAVKVHPILVFPGWMVETESNGYVKVLNPKLVRTHLKSMELYDEVISDTLINRISHQLSEISRLP